MSKTAGEAVAMMIWDRLGIITDEVCPALPEALDWMVERGLKHAEIRMVEGRNIMELSDAEVIEVRRQVERRGLFVSGIASPIFKCALDPTRTFAAGDTFGQKEEDVASHFAKLKRAIEIARLLRTTRIRIFSFWRESMLDEIEEEIVLQLRRAAVVAESENMQLLLENEPSCNGGFASEVARFVKEVNSPALKVLWDPGNEQYGGRTAFPDGYAQVRGLIAHVHLKDAYFSNDGESSCTPIGSGTVPFLQQLEALLEDGYPGLFTIETHYIPEGGTAMDGSTMTWNGLRALLERFSER